MAGRPTLFPRPMAERTCLSYRMRTDEKEKESIDRVNESSDVTRNAEDGIDQLHVLNITTTWKPKSSRLHSEMRATSQREKKVNHQAQVSRPWPLVQLLPKTWEIHQMGPWQRHQLGRCLTTAEFPCSSRAYVGIWDTTRETTGVAQATRFCDQRLELVLTVSRGSRRRWSNSDEP